MLINVGHSDRGGTLQELTAQQLGEKVFVSETATVKGETDVFRFVPASVTPLQLVLQ